MLLAVGFVPQVPHKATISWRYTTSPPDRNTNTKKTYSQTFGVIHLIRHSTACLYMSTVHITASLYSLPVHVNSTPHRFILQLASTCQQYISPLHSTACQYISNSTPHRFTLQLASTCQQYTSPLHSTACQYMSTVHITPEVSMGSHFPFNFWIR